MIDHEAGVIGEMCFKTSNIDLVNSMLSGADFVDSELGAAYSAIVSAYEEGKDIGNAVDISILLDVVGINSERVKSAIFSGAGVPIKHYAQKVLSDASKRAMLDFVSNFEHDIERGDKTERELICEASEHFQKLNSKHEGSGIKSAVEVVKSVSADFEIDCDRGFEALGISTGLEELDKKTGGFKCGEITIIAACTSVGKTALALNFAEHAAIKEHKSVVFFSFEMSAKSLVARMASSRSGVKKSDAVRSTDSELRSRFSHALADIYESGLYIGDSSNLTLSDVSASLKKFKASNGSLDLVVVDYLQLMTGFGQTQEQRVASISKGMKQLSVAIDCPIVVLSQLNRQASQRGSGKPVLSDLRDSGSIEQDADVVLFIDREKKEESEKASIIVAKNRNGPIGSIEVFFNGPLTKFEQIDWRHQYGVNDGHY